MVHMCTPRASTKQMCWVCRLNILVLHALCIKKFTRIYAITSGVTRGREGRTAPGDTIQGWHVPTKIILWLNLERTPGKRRRKVGAMRRKQLKRRERWLKRVVFGGKIGWRDTLHEVAAPGDIVTPLIISRRNNSQMFYGAVNTIPKLQPFNTTNRLTPALRVHLHRENPGYVYVNWCPCCICVFM